MTYLDVLFTCDHYMQRLEGCLAKHLRARPQGRVAPMPTLDVIPSSALGLIDEPRTPCKTSSPRSAWNRVAIAHSTSRSSKMSMFSERMDRLGDPQRYGQDWNICVPMHIHR